MNWYKQSQSSVSVPEFAAGDQIYWADPDGENYEAKITNVQSNGDYELNVSGLVNSLSYPIFANKEELENNNPLIEYNIYLKSHLPEVNDYEDSVKAHSIQHAARCFANYLNIRSPYTFDAEELIPHIEYEETNPRYRTLTLDEFEEEINK